MKYTLLLLTSLPLLAFAQEEDFFLDEEYPVAPDGTIELSCDDAEVNITGSDRETAHVVINRKVTAKGVVKNNQEFDVTVSEQDGDLVIEDQQNGSVSVVGYYSEEYTIDIEAPAGVSLNVRADDGNVTVQRTGGAITLRNDDGDVILQECTGNAFELTVDDGDIEMDQGQGTLTVRLDDGDLKVQEGDFSSVDILADDGDVTLATRLADDGTYAMETNDGQIDLQITGGGGTIEIRHDDTGVDTSGQFTLVESDDDYTQLSLPNGSAQVDIRVDDGQVDLSAL